MFYYYFNTSKRSICFNTLGRASVGAYIKTDIRIPHRKILMFRSGAVRGDCFSSLGAALGNALLHDIRHLLKPDVDLRHIVMDKAKLDSAKAKIKMIGDKLQAAKKSNCICLGVDSKIDENTLTYEEVQ